MVGKEEEMREGGGMRLSRVEIYYRIAILHVYNWHMS